MYDVGRPHSSCMHHCRRIITPGLVVPFHGHFANNFVLSQLLLVPYITEAFLGSSIFSPHANSLEACGGQLVGCRNGIIAHS